MTISIEDYLRTMYSLYEQLEDKSKGIKSVGIAKGLNVSRPSVSQMLNKLALKKYIKGERYSNIYFTKSGLRKARRIMHNHRVIEVFLRDILNCDLNKIHKEAHRLEHAFSEYVIKKLDNFLNNPKISPRGKLIPHDKANKDV